jgi:rhomboid protease GluP
MERSLGAGWMLTGFMVSAVLGNVVSALGNPPGVVAIGASGGVLGLVAMAAALTWFAPRLTGFSKSILVQWLVFALAVGFVAGFDNWGHIGGAIGGAACAGAAALLKDRRDALRLAGLVGGALGLLAAVLGLVLAAYNLLRPEP